MAKILVLALALGGLGCAAGRSESPSSPPQGLPLPAPGSGLYCLHRGGVPVGIERYTVTSSGAAWVLVGHQQHYGGAEVRLDYRLSADLRSGQPEAVELSVEVVGEARRVRVQRRGPWLEVEGDGAGGAFHRRVAFSPGTWIGFPSPLFEALAVGAREGPGPSHDRVVLLYPPELSAVVRRAEIEPRGVQGSDRRYLIRLGEGLAPVGLWLGADGHPSRVRRYLGDAVPLEAVRSSSCAPARSTSARPLEAGFPAKVAR